MTILNKGWLQEEQEREKVRVDRDGREPERCIIDTALWGHDFADAVEAMLKCHNYDGGGILSYMDKLYELLAKREKGDDDT